MLNQFMMSVQEKAKFPKYENTITEQKQEIKTTKMNPTGPFSKTLDLAISSPESTITIDSTAISIQKKDMLKNEIQGNEIQGNEIQGNEIQGKKKQYFVDSTLSNNRSKIHSTCQELQQLHKTPTLHDKCKLRAGRVGRCQDPLFWTVYLGKYGESEYNRIGGCTNGNVEMREKQKAVDFVKSKGWKYWNSVIEPKMTKGTFMERCDQILTLPKITWRHLPILCAYYNCTIAMIDLKTTVCMKILLSTSSSEDGENMDTFVLYNNSTSNNHGPLYWIDTAEQVLKLHEINVQCVSIIHYDKPLKAISNYKISELETMAQLLKMELPSKMKKQELYNTISLYCSTGNYEQV
jgi:hypothetical protein